MAEPAEHEPLRNPRGPFTVGVLPLAVPLLIVLSGVLAFVVAGRGLVLSAWPGTVLIVGFALMLIVGAVAVYASLWERRKLARNALAEAERRVEGQTAELEQARLEAQRERDSARQVMEAVAHGLTVTDFDGRFLYVNPAYARMVGRPPEEIVGKRPWDFTHSGDHHALATAVEARKCGETTSYETRLQRPDGSLVPVLITGVPRWVDGEVNGSFAAVMDLSERKQAEEALRDSEQRYRTLAETLPDAVFILRPDGRLAYVNRSAAAMMGRHPGELLEMGQDELFPPSLASKHLEAIRRLLATGEPYASESLTPVGNRNVWLDNRLEPLRSSRGEIAGVLGISRDIGDRKQADEALRASEERFRSLVEHALIGIYRTTPDGRFLMANPALLRLLGYSSLDELASENPEKLAARRGYPRETFKQLMERDGKVSGFDSTWTGEDGTMMHTRESAQAIRDATGAIQYYEGTVEDLTAAKALEDQLRRTQRMETVGRLAGGIAHDFNNLLQAILTNVQLVQLGGWERASGRDWSQRIEDLVKRGTALTRQLLLFSNRGVTQPRRLDLNQVLEGASTFLRRLVRENVRLTAALAGEPLLVDADPGQLEQVLANLVINAVDAMPEGGELAIRSGRDGGNVHFEVEDTGVGIPADALEAIFEPFFSTKHPSQGAGLGLAVVHGIVSQHGGRIEVRSEVGRGTTFRVVLPPHDSGVFPSVPAQTEPAVTPAGKSYRILVVEHSASVRTLIADMLSRLGYQTTAVESAEEAEALPVDQPHDLLLTDLMLPGASGTELARRLRQRWPRLSVLVMSGYAADESVRRGVTSGDLRFLPKPVSLETLARELRTALAEDVT